MILAALLLVLLVAGALVFTVLAMLAVLRRPRAVAPAAGGAVSVLKPLAGAEADLEGNLRSFFEQRYPDFEILFAVRTAADPAAALVERLRAEYPQVEARLLIVGEPPYPNAKVWSLAHMTEAARHDLLVMSDSDIRVTRDFLARVVGEFADAALGLTTCPYRAVGGPSLWSQLEAVMMNTDFLAGILVARMLEGMKFAVGPTVVGRKQALAAIGGWDRVKDYLAEDFVLGQFAAEAGIGVGLSAVVVEHRIGSQPWASNARHRLRWCRSTRRSRPAGYVGELFTFPLPLALLLLAVAPQWWPLAALAIVARVVAAVMTTRMLSAPLALHLLPLSDLASFAFWVAGFFGNTIDWRGRQYLLRADGRFERVGPAGPGG
ncbi:MAG: bacteriohopanetetrol glucosamine biosynthesis glycosyltransferase HpnI [Bryobacteraceae bacterium]